MTAGFASAIQATYRDGSWAAMMSSPSLSHHVRDGLFMSAPWGEELVSLRMRPFYHPSRGRHHDGPEHSAQDIIHALRSAHDAHGAGQ